MKKHGRDRLIRERHEVLAEALPHSLGVALAAAFCPTCGGKAEEQHIQFDDEQVQRVLTCSKSDCKPGEWVEVYMLYGRETVDGESVDYD